MFPFKPSFHSANDPSNSHPTNFSIENNQWVNQAVYQNVDLESVDWAALAQQWIFMKETCPTVETIPAAPPPPIISKPNERQQQKQFIEQGEAPMEVEPLDEHTETATTLQPPPAPSPPKIFNASGSSHHRNNSKNWHKKAPRWNDNNWSTNHQQTKQMHHSPINNSNPFVQEQTKATNQWPNSSSNVTFSQIGIGSNSNISGHLSQANDEKTGDDLLQKPLDAAQRKTLPAWIREGLEKMEREKQKEADRLREAKERDEKQKQQRLAEQKILELTGAVEMPILKSKFESDSENDDDDSGNDDINNKGNGRSTGKNESQNLIKPQRPKTEILQDIMLAVRKNLTEILLEVTNEIIEVVANETISKMRTKGRKAQAVQKNALTANSGKLGLVTYDDSDASRSDSDSDDDSSANTSGHRSDDSEKAILDAIKRRKSEFKRKAREIDEYLAEAEDKERLWLDSNDDKDKSNKNGSASTNIGKVHLRQESGEVQDDKNKMTSSSGRHLERRSSRFGETKGFVYNVASAINTTSVAISQNNKITSVNNLQTRKDSESGSDLSSEKSSSQANKDKMKKCDKKQHRNKKRHRDSSSSSDTSYYSKSSSHKRSNKYSRRDRSRSPRHRYRSRTRSRSREHDRNKSQHSRNHKNTKKSNSRSRSRDKDRSRHRHR